jgi:hypothetical protein
MLWIDVPLHRVQLPTAHFFVNKMIRRISLTRNMEERREYQRKWHAEIRAKNRLAYFSGKKCTYCGSTERLELHHLDPSTKESHDIWDWAEKSREKELTKCIVLCNTCHRKETYNYMTRNTFHGSLAMYKRHKCRCELCKKVAQDYNREYKIRKKKEKLLLFN